MKLEIDSHTVCKTTRTQNVFNVSVANKGGLRWLQKKGIISTLEIFNAAV